MQPTASQVKLLSKKMIILVKSKVPWYACIQENWKYFKKHVGKCLLPFKNHSTLTIKANRFFFRLLKMQDWFIEFKFVHFYDCCCCRQNRTRRRSVERKKKKRVKDWKSKCNQGIFLCMHRFHKVNKDILFLIDKEKNTKREMKLWTENYALNLGEDDFVMNLQNENLLLWRAKNCLHFKRFLQLVFLLLETGTTSMKMREMTRGLCMFVVFVCVCT